jgi:hypothetical protein
VSDRHDLDFSAGPLAINQEEWKLSQQEPAGIVGTAYPAVRSFRNLDQRTIKFRVELQGRVGGFLVQFYRPSRLRKNSLL